MNEQEKSKNIISGENQRIFLASPYTHKDKKVMNFRYVEAIRASARLTNAGHLVFSPIVHSHPIAIAYDLPREYAFWQAYSNSFILHWAEAFSVLCLQDWEDSAGIGDESILARKVGLPFSFIYLG